MDWKIHPIKILSELGKVFHFCFPIDLHFVVPELFYRETLCDIRKLMQYSCTYMYSKSSRVERYKSLIVNMWILFGKTSSKVLTRIVMREGSKSRGGTKGVETIT